MSILVITAAIVIVVILLFALMMMKKENFAPGADFASLNNIKYSPSKPGAVIQQSMYQPTYTPKITYAGRVIACPPGTTDVGDK